jgi:hypothetical protein
MLQSGAKVLGDVTARDAISPVCVEDHSRKGLTDISKDHAGEGDSPFASFFILVPGRQRQEFVAPSLIEREFGLAEVEQAPKDYLAAHTESACQSPKFGVLPL